MKFTEKNAPGMLRTIVPPENEQRSGIKVTGELRLKGIDDHLPPK